MFGGATPNRTGTGQPNPDGVFADVFDEVFFIAALQVFATNACLIKLYFLLVIAPRN